MNSVKINKATKEIAIKGSKSFIESHSDIIGKFPLRSSGAGGGKGPTRPGAHWKVVTSVETGKPRKTEMTGTPAVIDTPPATQAATSMKAEAPQGPQAKRPPVRKYFNTSGKLIRSENTGVSSAEKRVVVDAIENLPKGMSIFALKEKFGLSENKIKAIIEEAEKQGKVRRDLDGSLVWV